MTSVDAREFYVGELRRAVNEQRFGVAEIGDVSLSVPPGSPGAIVHIRLLEDKMIKVKLNLDGYRVVSLGSASRGRKFETIEGLLELESPVWNQRRMEILMSKLSRIAEAQ
ncbi:hypothetical protein DL93DRAFT_2151828 [Clavulina sp. PMI_390]|nr:hypothetical protein DL93DRAFT_2151828 [Clavulina sp. PMI_390]